MQMACQVTIDLQGVLSPGSVIGKGGRNVKWLSRESGGATLSVLDDNHVLVKARSRDAIKRAVQLLQAQIDANARLASPAYPTPLRVDYLLLNEPFGDHVPRVCFQYRGDESARATGRREQLYVLAPANEPQGGDVSGGGSNDSVDLAAALFAGVSLRPASSVATQSATSTTGKDAAQFHEFCDQETASLARALSESATLAAAHTPAFDILKLRLNLGKQFFFNLGVGMQARREVPLKEVQGLGSDKKVSQSVFSNCVPASSVQRVVRYLKEQMEFTCVNTKISGTLHVIHEALNLHYSIALTLPIGHGSGADAVTLRKVKSSPAKCHFVTLLGSPGQLDLRLKLIGMIREMRDPTATSVAQQLLNACNRHGYDAVAGPAAGSLYLPQGMYLDQARKKTKTVYEGSIPCPTTGGRLPVRLSVLQVHDKDGSHTEISGSFPNVDLALSQLLASARAAGGGGGGATAATGDGAAAAATAGGARAFEPADESQWALDALNALSEFLTGLNNHLKG